VLSRCSIQIERLFRLLPIHFDDAWKSQSVVVAIRELELRVLDGWLLVEVLAVKGVPCSVTFARTLIPPVVPVVFGLSQLLSALLLWEGSPTFESLII